MKLNAIHHVAIIVSDIHAAREFYVEKLGFQVIRENYRDERKDWKLDLKIGDGGEANRTGDICGSKSAKACKPTGSLRASPSGISCGECRRNGRRIKEMRD